MLSLLGAAGAPRPATAQSCPPQGPGFQGGEIVQRFSYLDENGDPQPVPDGKPLPTGEGLNVLVDGTATVVGSCQIFGWNGSSCAPEYVQLSTIGSIVGKYVRPGEDPNNPNQIYEFALNPDGTTASVQFMDSSDDSNTSAGPVTYLPSGGAPSSAGVSDGTYMHRSISRVTDTLCDSGSPNYITADWESFSVKDQAISKNTGCSEQVDGIANPCSARTGDKWEREVDHPGPVLPFVRHYSSLS